MQYQHHNEINGNTTHASYIKCWTMHKILLGLYPNPHMKSAPCLTFSWICKVVNYFVWLKLKVPMSGQVIVIEIYLFWYSWWLWCWFILVVIYIVSLLAPIKIKINKIYFPYRRWDIWINFKFLCTVFFHIYPCTCYCLSKSWWDNLCFLGVPCMLWMHM